MSLFTALLGRLAAGENLSLDEMTVAMNAVMDGQIPDEQIALLLTALRAKGETVDEIAGAAQSLRMHMTRIRSHREGVIDTCGTGGGGSKLFNISTTAALVTAAAGVPVAKHGNRAVTSRSGSSDVLAALGVNISADVKCVERCLDELGICFCFAPLVHPSMKRVSEVRNRLGVPTIFNLLGPLCNPAGAPFQLLGVGRPELRPVMAAALASLGTQHSAIVSGGDGLGEVNIAGATQVTEVIGPGTPHPGPLPQGEREKEGNLPQGEGEQRGNRQQGERKQELREIQWNPSDFDLPMAESLDALIVENAAQSAEIIRKVLAGESGIARGIVVANAAAALWVAGKVDALTAGTQLAQQAIDCGDASRLLDRLIQMTNATI